jgi:hypothetical protein
LKQLPGLVKVAISRKTAGRIPVREQSNALISWWISIPLSVDITAHEIGAAIFVSWHKQGYRTSYSLAGNSHCFAAAAYLPASIGTTNCQYFTYA